MSAPAVELQGARLGYGKAVVLPRVELVIEPGECVGVVGPNGCGKTTLLRAVLGAIEPMEGHVEVRARVGYCPQRTRVNTVFPFTAADVVGMGARARTADLSQRVAQALEACGLPGASERLFRDLSGGQQQRVLLARALIGDPELILLDEPTRGLDLAGEHEVMEQVARLNREGKTVVLVSHQLHVVARYATRLVLIHQGELTVGPTSEVLTSERLQAVYGFEVRVDRVAGLPVVLPGPGAGP